MLSGLTTEQAAVLVAIVTSVFGPGIGAWLAWRRTIRGAEAQAQRDMGEADGARAQGEAVLSEVILKWSDRLQAQIVDLKADLKVTQGELASLRRKLKLYERYVIMLIEYARMHGGDNPPAMPLDED